VSAAPGPALAGGAALAVPAPAKVNLALHVTGRRGDGYHLLDTLVAFAGVGDRVTLRVGGDPGGGPGADLATGQAPLTVAGPERAGVPAGPDNLILRAAALAPAPVPVTFRLDKVLPSAAGLGGGSADAAAALRGLVALGATMPGTAALAALGADVPMCVAGRPLRARGIGDVLDDPGHLPELPAVLVNPRVAVPTAEVFAGLACREGTPLPELPEAGWADAPALAAWLRRCRNDLEAPARRIAPAIGRALDRLAATPACRLARMSGSGATCFGLYPDMPAAETAAALLRAERPGWWIVVTRLGAPDGAPRRA